MIQLLQYPPAFGVIFTPNALYDPQFFLRGVLFNFIQLHPEHSIKTDSPGPLVIMVSHPHSGQISVSIRSTMFLTHPGCPGEKQPNFSLAISFIRIPPMVSSRYGVTGSLANHSWGTRIQLVLQALYQWAFRK